MNRTRHQGGYIYARSGYWYLRYRADVRQSDGSIKQVHHAHRLASVCRRYSTRKSVRVLADEYLLEHNNGSYNVDSTMTLRAFVEERYFLHYAQQNWRPSVLNAELWRWRKNIAPFCGNVRLGDFRPQDGQVLINRLAAKGELSRSSLHRIRSLLSGIFAEAKRQGSLGNVPNPIQVVRIPRNGVHRPLREPEVTHAYTLSHIKQMLDRLPDPDRTIVAVFALTGLRAGEVTALDWTDWKDGYLSVWKSDWEGQVTETKTSDQRLVPVIQPLRDVLQAYRVLTGNPQAGRIFEHKGRRVSLRNRAREGRRLRRILAQHGIPWYGWHAFRRGLATNLKDLGVPTSTIQAILGHRNPRTTEAHYIKTRQAELETAMGKLEAVLCAAMCADKHLARETARLVQ